VDRNGAPHGSAVGGGSFGFAVGAHALAGSSFAAGGAVIHDSGGAPVGAFDESAGRGSVFVGGGCAGAFAAGPGANKPESDESRSSTAGGTPTDGDDGSATGPKPPMRWAISAWRSSRTSG